MATGQVDRVADTITRLLGERVRDARRAAGLTQEQLAFKAGVTRETVRAAEAGRHMPKLTTLELVAQGVGVSLWDLLPARPEADGGRGNEAAKDTQMARYPAIAA